VEFTLTDREFAELDTAAGLAGLSRGAYAAQAALVVARGGANGAGVPMREALVELMAAAGLARRIGTNLNQAVARLNATGQRGEDLLPAAQFCARVMHRTGLAPDGDDLGVRWGAVRHAADRIHIVATLARQDGARPRIWGDYYQVREACQDAERRFGLRSTAPADRTAARRPSLACAQPRWRDQISPAHRSG
jgi:hypothetical protein